MHVVREEAQIDSCSLLTCKLAIGKEVTSL